jgi:hypothetical protein
LNSNRNDPNSGKDDGVRSYVFSQWLPSYSPQADVTGSHNRLGQQTDQEKDLQILLLRHQLGILERKAIHSHNMVENPPIAMS